MIDEYEYFKRLGLGCKMNLIFAAHKNMNSYTLDGKMAAEEICKFFDYWILDTYRPADSDLCERYLMAALMPVVPALLRIAPGRITGFQPSLTVRFIMRPGLAGSAAGSFGIFGRWNRLKIS